MHTYLLLLRGINVGGKNLVPMDKLRAVLENEGFASVSTYIASGNVILKSGLSAKHIASTVEGALTSHFKLDSKIIKVLVLSTQQLQTVVNEKPAGFGEQPSVYHSDVIFLIDVLVEEALTVFKPRANVDAIWPGTNVIYSQRLSAQRTKSGLSKIVGTKPYQSMTIRTWNTVTKLLALMKEHDQDQAGRK